MNNSGSVTGNQNLSSHNEVSNKKYVDDSIGGGTIVRFNQTLENYLEVSVGTDTYKLTKHTRIQIVDATEINFPNIRSDLIQKRKMECINKFNQSRKTDFIKSTKSNSPTGYSGATKLPPIGSAFLYIENSSNIHGHERVFVSFEGTVTIQVSNITLYYNRFSILTFDSKKSMGRFRIQFLLEDYTWSTEYKIDKNDRYMDSSINWTLVNLNFIVEKYGNKIIYDEIGSAHADMSFSNITITHSVN